MGQSPQKDSHSDNLGNQGTQGTQSGDQKGAMGKPGENLKAPGSQPKHGEDRQQNPFIGKRDEQTNDSESKKRDESSVKSA